MNPYRFKREGGGIGTFPELKKQDFRRVAVFYSVWLIKQNHKINNVLDHKIASVNCKCNKRTLNYC
jgi:hypothetical protein